MDEPERSRPLRPGAAQLAVTFVSTALLAFVTFVLLHRFAFDESWPLAARRAAELSLVCGTGATLGTVVESWWRRFRLRPERRHEPS